MKVTHANYAAILSCLILVVGCDRFEPNEIIDDSHSTQVSEPTYTTVDGVKKAYISDRLLDTTGGSPVQNAEVVMFEAWRWTDNLEPVARTDENGFYAFNTRVGYFGRATSASAEMGDVDIGIYPIYVGAIAQDRRRGQSVWQKNIDVKEYEQLPHIEMPDLILSATPDTPSEK
ncbi:MAG: hypothetical protein KC944_17760 [Candidatus Omnitrophica bacterium]|nr:hypothetical protein [Candidatus Omnitrophota bacterium]